MFLNFMLARLLSARQVVLLCDVNRTRLFYRGQVYSRLTVPGFENLPKRTGVWYHPIWALMDMDTRTQEPPLRWRGCLADPGVFSKPRSMESVAQAVQGCSVRDASMGYEGADGRVRLSLVPPFCYQPRPYRLIEVGH